MPYKWLKGYDIQDFVIKVAYSHHSTMTILEIPLQFTVKWNFQSLCRCLEKVFSIKQCEYTVLLYLPKYMFMVV